MKVKFNCFKFKLNEKDIKKSSNESKNHFLDANQILR